MTNEAAAIALALDEARQALDLLTPASPRHDPGVWGALRELADRVPRTPPRETTRRAADQLDILAEALDGAARATADPDLVALAAASVRWGAGLWNGERTGFDLQRLVGEAVIVLHRHQTRLILDRERSPEAET